MKKRILSLILILALCLSLGTFILPQEARADSYETFDTSKTYFLWLKEDNGAMNYRWNADGTDKKDVIHLDVPSGGNCVMTFTASTEAGYYGIRCQERYINTKDNNEKPGQYLHQWEDFYEGDNQKFKFIPVEGEADTYYIQMKKGGLYVGLQGNNAERYSIIETADSAHKCKWVVVPTDRAPFPTDKTQTFDTSKEFYLWLKDESGDDSYRWNADGTGKGKVIHLDIPAGSNCKFTLKDAGGGWYGIKCSEGRLYVDTDENDNQLQRVLHQYHDDLKQDNQKFQFIPVEGEDNTYYIRVKNSGLYVGLNGFNPPERGRTLVTADAEHACKWEVVSTDMTQLEPNAMLPGAKDHIGHPADGALTFMMNPVGYQSGLSVHNDAKARGDRLHLWTMGHFCKVTAEYIDEDKNGVVQDAYRIRSFDYFENSTSALVSIGGSFVWDVDDQSKDDGAVIHIWDQGDDNKASTLWRFIAVPGQEDVYYIQNVNSHLYVGLDSQEDKDGVILKQTSKKVPWEIHWLYAGDETYYGYSVDNNGNVTDPSGRINSGNWMSRLPDELPLSQVNIPGTHDSGSTRFWTTDSNFINEGVGQILAQMLYLDEQLNSGVRAWDIRVSNGDGSSTDADTNSDPRIIHGQNVIICHDRWGNELHLSAVMDTAKDFLNSHPKETIVIKIGGQGDGGNGLDFICNALSRYILPDLTAEQQTDIENGSLTYDDIGPKYPIYIPSKEDLNTKVPTLGDVRGKIVFLNGAGVPFVREDPNDNKSAKIPIPYADDREEYLFRACGPNISPWVINKVENNPPKCLQKIKDTCAWAQDAYNTRDVKLKMEYVDGAFDDLSRNHQSDSAYVLNYASAADDIDVSKSIFEKLRAEKTLDQTSGVRVNTGILFVNEIDPVMTRRIYMTNFDVNGTALPSRLPVVAFDSKGGSGVPYQMLQSGACAVKPDDPVRSGYTFLGWQLDGKDYDFSTPVTESFTLTALWQLNGSGRDAWYRSAVDWAVKNGLMNGVSEDAFAPNDTCTRAMIVTMLWRLAGEPAAGGSDFDDVSSGAWYAQAVAWAAETGAVKGTSDTAFSPNTPVTREQLAAILYRYAQAQGKGFTGAWMFLLDYPDADQVSEWANEAMHWMTMHGVIDGMGDGTLAPKDNATRAQIAAMFMRFCAEMEKQSDSAG